MVRARLFVLLTLMACACSSKGEPASGADTGQDQASGEGSDSGGLDDSTPPPALPLANGTYLVGFSVGAVAGLVVSLQVEIAMSADEAGDRTIDSFVLRATDGVEAVSEDLTSVVDVSVDEAGAFTAEFPVFTLPAEFSPTSNPVDLDATMVGTIESESFFCGEVRGAIVSFEMDLAGSSFGATPWADRILGARAACEEVELEPVDRIDTCPTLTDGRMDDFSSGGETRTFDLILPDAYDATSSWPLVFALHGIGESIDPMAYGSGLADYASANGFIVAAPQAMDRGGTAAWDPVGPPDYNLDIVFFDDMLTCIREQYTVDPDRVHVTGMSLGGLMTGTLIATRSEEFGSAAPLSGGFMTQPTADTVPIPSLVVWGGEDDTYYGQDFNSLGLDMIDTLVNGDHFVVACNHGLGHSRESEFWPFVFGFFADHPRGVEPEPYLEGLPEVFPEYCGVVAQESGR